MSRAVTEAIVARPKKALLRIREVGDGYSVLVITWDRRVAEAIARRFGATPYVDAYGFARIRVTVGDVDAVRRAVASALRHGEPEPAPA